ncbi:MAG: hypothetical protein JO151_21455 [Verrucomicrobia bacterium]|nr:hypothetical protein [Verrucomicrobiota bacterium]
MNCKPDLARSEDKPSGRILIAAASRLAYGGTEDLMRGECLGAISILRLFFHRFTIKRPRPVLDDAARRADLVRNHR